MLKRLNLFFVIIYFGGLPLFTLNSPFETAEASSTTHQLTQTQAEKRSKLVEKPNYQLEFHFDKTQDQFKAKARIDFELLKLPKKERLFLDLNDATIESITLNGTSISTSLYKNHRITLPVSHLKPRLNQLEVTYARAYSSTGNGLHRFQDPVDQKIYLYSNLEPYYANHIFPCFDQPDLKGTYQVSAWAPKAWTVIANGIVEEKKEKDDLHYWKFKKTKRFSTYLFALHAGEFHQWRSRYQKIPLRLFARKSLAHFVDAREWFQITRLGLSFFEKKFRYPYPFQKYDQLIVPDFNWGAMENVGAVTFSERFIFRSKVTDEMRIDRSDVILHEMAHMWFGNLVTMRWWNDLWLNESFATFAAAWANEFVTKKIGLQGVWQSFFKDMKRWAYYEDQLPSSHPIKATVKNTDQAFASFDGITYGKGASVLKQIFFLMGEEHFAQGLQTYFKAFEFQNTELEDFISHLSKAAERDLTSWKNQWLLSPGTNTLRVSYACDQDQKVSEVKLTQGQLQFPKRLDQPMRSHRVNIGFYQSKKGQPAQLISKVDTVIDQKTQKLQLKSPIECPDFVFANQDDYGFIALEFDSKAITWLLNHLSKIKDDLTRLQIWHELWRDTFHSRLPAQTFVKLAQEHLVAEKNPMILHFVLSKLISSTRSSMPILFLLSDQGGLQSESLKSIEELSLDQFKKAPSRSDAKLLWLHTYLRSTHSKTSQSQILKWLEGNETLPGLKLDQQLRWDFIWALARQGTQKIKERIEKELKKDPSDLGKKQAYRAKASIPSEANQKKWIQHFTTDLLQSKKPPIPMASLKFAISGLNGLKEGAIDSEIERAFYTYLPKLDATVDRSYVEQFARSFYPKRCDESARQKLKNYLRVNSNLSASTKKQLKRHLFEAELCIQARRRSNLAKKNDPILN